MLVEDKVDMYLDMDDSDYVDETNFDRKEPMVKRRLRSKKNRPRKDERKQLKAKNLRHSELIDDKLDMYIDMKNMEEMDEMDALNSEESRKKPRVYMIGYFY